MTKPATTICQNFKASPRFVKGGNRRQRASRTKPYATSARQAWMKSNKGVENESFNDHFCKALELYLNQTLSRFDDKRLNSFSCDGILPPFMDKQLTKKSVNDTRRISGITVFFLGGEDHPNNTVYELTLKLGKYSLRRYAKGSSMIDCIPGDDSKNAMVVDADIKQMELTLR